MQLNNLMFLNKKFSNRISANLIFNLKYIFKVILDNFINYYCFDI